MMEEKEALSRCAMWCSQCERCLSDAKAKLEQYGMAPDAVARILKRLVDERYIDEGRYARFYAKDKMRFNGWGPMKIRFGLAQKHLPKNIIDDALADINPDDFEQTLHKALSAKARTAKTDDTAKLKASLVRLGASRGFAYDMTMATANKIIADMGGDADDDF